MTDKDRAIPGNVGSSPRHRYRGGRVAVADEIAWTIRAIKQGDRADAKRLFLALHTYNASLDSRFALSMDWEQPFDAGLDRLLAGGEGIGLLAHEGASGRAIGLAIAATHQDGPLWAVRDWLELEDLYVEPAWRGTGVASALVARVEDWARVAGVDTIQLYATASNARALAFYDKEGFHPAQLILRKQVAAPQYPRRRGDALQRARASRDREV